MSRFIKIHGMVDPHTHLRDLDWTHKATFTTETAAALAGGYWAVFDMPNTAPSTISRNTLESKLTQIDQYALCDWGLYYGASQSDNTASYAKVAQHVCGLKIFNNATTGDLLIDNQPMREKHYNAWPASRIIAVHAEGETVLDILEMVRKFGKHTHFLHISTAEEIQHLRAAKEEGLPITIGVCPHHLYLTDDDEKTLGPYGIMKPGLKTSKDRDTLWEALKDGLIDVVESDHAPHTIAEKESDTPPFGVPGLETTLPLLLTAVVDGRLSLDRVIDLVANNPQRTWGLNSPPDTYTVVDLDASYVIERAKLHTKCSWSPFEGMRVTGQVVETWIRGQKVFDQGQILVEPGFGNNLFS